jgi:hypothetical protein
MPQIPGLVRFSRQFSKMKLARNDLLFEFPFLSR